MWVKLLNGHAPYKQEPVAEPEESRGTQTRIQKLTHAGNTKAAVAYEVNATVKDIEFFPALCGENAVSFINEE